MGSLAHADVVTSYLQSFAVILVIIHQHV